MSAPDLMAQVDAILAAHRVCASCGDPTHTIWRCPDEARKDREAFAAMLDKGLRAYGRMGQ